MEHIMQDYELDAYLGGVEATDDQRAAMLAASDAIAARYPDPDLQSSAEEAFSAATQVILGDDTLASIAQEWRAAKAAERAVMERLTGAIIVTFPMSSEKAISERVGLNRDTVRRALGKRRG